MTRHVRIIPALLSAALVVFAFGFVVVARAGTVDAPVQRRLVSYADLNLEHPSDAAKLYGRIERAADRVCHSEIGPFAQAQSVMRRCVTVSVANAVASVSNPNLTALYAARKGGGASPITAQR
jgi:UrcA family protein